MKKIMEFTFTKSKYFRHVIHPILTKLPCYAYFLLKKKSYLKSVGWFRSFKSGKSINSEGKPIPWFTYGAIELLRERLPKDIVVFEYGSGLGTKWWAENSLQVDVVEHDKRWYKMILNELPENVKIQHKKLHDDYETAIAESGKNYDVIVIDGKNRIECTRKAIHCLSDKGIVIYDDTDRPKSDGIIQFFNSKGFKHLPFVGFSPIEFMKCETSFFYREDNLLKL